MNINMMTLQRYKNELILFLALLFAVFAFMYKLSANDYVQENRTKIQTEIMEINKLISLKELWASKNLSKKIKTLKTIVERSKIVSFKKKSKKVIASYKNLTGNELSKVSNKLINMPVQIILFNITQSAKNQYTLEFTCKW